jgi:diguanylate cyclase (GGDEF)-like protein
VPFLSRLSPVARLSFGLIALIGLLLMLAHLFLGVLPDQATLAQRNRQALSESLAVQLTSLVEKGDRDTLSRTLQTVTQRDDNIVSVGVRRADGSLLAEAGGHRVSWLRPNSNRSTLTHVIVPIHASGQHWGDIEVQFTPLTEHGWRALFANPVSALLLIVSVPGLIVFYLYLRRALQYLDPTAVVPERVRAAFDALSEGVIVLDAKGRIALANRAFRRLHADASRNPLGQPASALPWLKPALPKDPAQHPWQRSYASKQAVVGCEITIAQEQSEPKKVVVNTSPVLDVQSRVRGCLVTFDDRSELDRANAQLRVTLDELERSKRQIAQQNEELQKLALRDPLTSCLNRRSFIEQAIRLFRQAQDRGIEISCVMADIDHFKSYNDRFGHAVGDQVIVAVAQALQSKLGEDALLCRYGGEEFCVLLPNTKLEQAEQVAERMRAHVEAAASADIAALRGLAATASFGVSALRFGSTTIEQLIDQADHALYASKKRGRNCVSRHDAAEASLV